MPAQATTYVPLAPWLEANQGLLSTLALVAALTVAVIEFLRAERAERRAAGREIDATLRVLSDCVAQIAPFTKPQDVTGMYVTLVIEIVKRTRRLLESVGSRTSVALLAVSIQETDRKLQVHLSWQPKLSVGDIAELPAKSRKWIAELNTLLAHCHKQIESIRV